MKRVFIIVVAAALAAVALATPLHYEYAGKWGKYGPGDGEFNSPIGVALAANTNVYVGDWYNDRVQYFTSTGSFLGKWGLSNVFDLAFGRNGYLYATTWTNNYVHYFSSTGSQVGSWPAGVDTAGGVTVAANGDVFVSGYFSNDVKQYTSTGSAIRSFGSGYLNLPLGVGVASTGNVYVANYSNYGVVYFASTGSFLGSWRGSLTCPLGDVAVGPRDEIIIGDWGGNYVYFFTPTGSVLGSFGGYGSGNGQFDGPSGIGLAADGTLYVAEQNNNRVQYFRGNVTVIPTSLGKVKALFR